MFAKALTLISACILTGCASLQLDRVAVPSTSDWLVDGQTQTRTRVSPVSIAPPLEMAWEYNAAAGFGPGSPLIVGGTVLVATRKGEIHAIELETGNRRGYREFGEPIEGSPLIAGKVLFVPMAWGGRVLAAYDLERGDIRWRVRGVPIESSLVKVDDMVIGVDVEGTIHAYDMDEGDVRWELELDEPVLTSPLAFDDGRVFVVTDQGNAAMLDGRSGALMWSVRLEAPAYTSPAAVDDLIVVPTTRGLICGLDARTGNILWTRKVGESVVRVGAVAVSSDRVYLGTTEGRLLALDSADGSIQWEQHVPDAVSAAPMVVGEHVYFGTLGNWLYGLDRISGEIIWSHEAEGRIKSAMAVQDQGLLVLTEPRYVYLFRPVPERIAGQ